MKLLLDTHVWLWLALDPDRVSADVRNRIDRVDTELYVSVASLWEVRVAEPERNGRGRKPRTARGKLQPEATPGGHHDG